MIYTRGMETRPAKHRLILVGGGARSGKSAFALRYARRLGERRVFVATAQGFDEEMRMRIERHQQDRGRGFVTIEEPRALSETLGRLDNVDVVLIDCLTLWLSNLLVGGASPEQVAASMQTLSGCLAQRRYHALIVTNEVGMGLVPETPLGRVFRDVTGQAHQSLALAADEIYFTALGTVLRLRPPPVVIEEETGP